MSMTKIFILPMQGQHVEVCARLVVARPLWGERYDVTSDAPPVRFEDELIFRKRRPE